MRDLTCQLHIHEIEKSCFNIGPFIIHSNYVIHPGPTLGFRVSSQQNVLCYIPDHEPALGEKGMIRNTKWISGIDLAEGADILIHDSQYTAAEYQNKKGWGHSSINDAALFSSLAGVKRVLYAHHDPLRTDKQADEMLASLKTTSDYLFEQEMAREGTEIELG